MKRPLSALCADCDATGCTTPCASALDVNGESFDVRTYDALSNRPELAAFYAACHVNELLSVAFPKREKAMRNNLLLDGLITPTPPTYFLAVKDYLDCQDNYNFARNLHDARIGPNDFRPALIGRAKELLEACRTLYALADDNAIWLSAPKQNDAMYCVRLQGAACLALLRLLGVAVEVPSCFEPSTVTNQKSKMGG